MRTGATKKFSRFAAHEYAGPTASRLEAARQTAFTLIELLVVIVIIGLLATIGLPAIRGMSKSNALISANRQLLDDIAYARQRAISDHTPVYIVFIPPQIVNFAPQNGPANLMTQYTNLYLGQYTTYALLSLRSVGEQPGRSTPHYLTGWRSLPHGCFIATNKFAFTQPAFNNNPTQAELNIVPFLRSQGNNPFPFPTATNVNISANLPYIQFDYLGRLASGVDEYIPLALGSILFGLSPNGGYDITQSADIQETPAGNSVTVSNVIHIDWLTGKAHVERQEVQ